MTIPPLKVWEDARFVYRNLIAFEQCDSSKDFEVTSYAKLFADLINNDQDVDFLKDLYREVNAHYRRRCNRWRATLKRDYFGNPWSIISLMAAFLILIFTFSQTLYSVISYYKRPSNIS